MQEDVNKTVFKRSKVKRLLTSILEDPDMTYEFVVETAEAKLEPIEEIQREKVQEQPRVVRQPVDKVDKEEPKGNVSRLQIQIDKNDFNVVPLAGQVFLMLTDACLQGKKSQQHGKIMLTNFRILFFKSGNKRVDLPFGSISKVEYIDKHSRIIYKLKYPHFWKFTISSYKKYEQLKNIGNIYYKTNQVKRMFAFEYAMKLTPIPYPYHFSLQEQYLRLKFQKNSRGIQVVHQLRYDLCFSYPWQLYSVAGVDLRIIANHHKNKRFPILAYKYTTHSKIEAPLWISSAYQEPKSINKNAEKQFLMELKCGMKLQVFVCQGKNSRAFEEQSIDKHINMHYLKLQSNDELKNAKDHLFQVFLANKKPFIKQILASKWYNYIVNILQSLQVIRNTFIHQDCSVLIRCEGGLDKSLVLSSLLQIVLDRQFRTFKGFQMLVMRMFIHYGHPFAERLGLRGDAQELACPTFLQFLDCTAQLINQNPSSFQYNFKYLAKIANLMQINIYGTFLANNSHQYRQNRIDVQTCSIWPDIITPITTNGFYDKSGAILSISPSISSVRIWKEYFGDMISLGKDHYGYQEIAEDNDDYLNLYCLRLKQENIDLMSEMKRKMALVQKLQKQLRERGQNTHEFGTI